MSTPPSSSSSWPNHARAAITLTFDNMGEAADLNRNLWPSTSPIGTHYSVTTVLPQFLSLVQKYQIKITYFAEAWNLHVYPAALERIARDGHEVAWHAWQHEMWGVQCEDAGVERRNFERSFGEVEGIRWFLNKEGGEGGGGGKGSKVEVYRGFRPPGGTIHGERTLRLCREFGLGYISPAAEEAALMPLDGRKEEEEDSIVVLPFRWRGVDAYYYMESFSGLRKMKGEFGAETQSPQTLVQCFIKLIDEAIAAGGFCSLLFHPFLNDAPERLEAMETVLEYLAKKREEGTVWIARCRDVEEWIRAHPGAVGEDPQWDGSTWR